MGASAPDGLIDELLEAYGEPHRAYHTTEHLTECFGHLDASPVTPESSGLLELALWFHDAVYDTKASDSEAKSAAWASRALACLGAERVEVIVSHILVTAHTGVPSDDDQRLLLDVDLSILGAPGSRFQQYEDQVRQEYEWVSQDVYRAARAKILSQFADRPRLYHTEHFYEQLEAGARNNLQRSLASLAA